MTTVAEVARACGLPWMPVAVDPPPARDAAGTWDRLDALTSSAALASQLAVVRAESEGRHDVATAFVAARFASPLARMAVVPVLAFRRVLAFVPDQVWLRQDRRGLITGVRGVGAGLSDPAQPAPRATALEPALAGYRPVVAGLRAVGALGERALWGQMADTLVAVIGRTLGDNEPAAAAEEAGRWLRSADPPLWVEPEFARVLAGGTARLVWRRGSCCLAYRLPAFGLCTGCPLQSRSQWLAAAAAR